MHKAYMFYIDSQNRMDTIFENEMDEALLSASPSYSKSVSSDFDDDLKSEHKTSKGKDNNIKQKVLLIYYEFI